MYTRIILIASFRLASCYTGRFWPRNLPSHLERSPQVLAAQPDSANSLQELDALLAAQASWQHHDRKSDCFRRVAGFVRSQCAQLDMNESERVSAAISMTLCELATAKHHSIPFECAEFSLDPKDRHDSPSVHMQGECVDALARSAQFWSSYSGYLREIPQLCFAFRRWHDIDTARDIYVNATLDQATLLRHIIRREEVTELNLQAWEGHLKDLHQAISQVQSAAGDVYLNGEQLGSLLKAALHDMVNGVQAVVGDLREEQQHYTLRLSNQFAHAFDELYQNHALQLHALAPSLGLSMTKQLDAITDHYLANTRGLLDTSVHVQQQWTALGVEIDDLSRSISFLSATATEIAHAFDGSVQQAQLITQIQQEASLSATDLVSALSNLTSTTHAELARVNNASIAMMQQRWLYTESDGFSWIASSVMRFVKTLLRAHGIQWIVHFSAISATLFAFVLFFILLVLLDFYFGYHYLQPWR